ncbi:hypothetical protein ACJIZ3_023914 [Penstemon smallii]|uniref:Uncharacterized protein n=1 Tax=Penstemon smallii TaxID=265156 RepID=A0ABD3TSU6_9LAMI
MGKPRSSSSSSTTPRTERKVLEKNRRNRLKEFLLPTKNSYSWITTENQATNKKSLLVEVHEIGPKFVCHSSKWAQGLFNVSRDNKLHQHGFEIANAIFSLNGNSSIQVLHDKSQMEFGGASISPEWLKELICGNASCSRVVESQINLWDFEFETNLWNFDQISEVFPPEI